MSLGEFVGRFPKDEFPSCDPDDDDKHRDRRHEGFTDGRYDDRKHDRDDDKDRHRRSGRLVIVRNHEPDGGTPYLNNPEITYAGDGAGGTARAA